MQMNATMERFYLAILAYAGIAIKDNVMVNVNTSLGDLKIDGQPLTLPYLENLKNPGNNHIFHPLNENFASPENTHFSLFKRKVTFELNLRLSTLMISMMSLAANPIAQQRLKSSEAIELMTALGEVDVTTIEYFVKLVKASQTANDAGYLFDIYLKKNGTVKDASYLAIGKINFILYRELQKALSDSDKSYKVFGEKLRKKDIITLISVFETIFPNISNPDDFTVGTDNRVFRYLSGLLLTTYPVAYRMNEIADLLEEAKDPSLALEEVRSDLSWAKQIEDVYGITDEIRNIPNQTCIKSESNQLRVDESKVKDTGVVRSGPPVYVPPAQPQSAATPAQQPQTVQQPQQYQTFQQPPAQPQQPLSVEDIVRNAGMPQYGMVPPGYYPQQFPGYPQMVPQQPMYQQQSPQPNMVNQNGWVPMNPYPQQYPTMGYPNGMPMSNMQPMQPPPQQGIPLNPHLLRAPW